MTRRYALRVCAAERQRRRAEAVAPYGKGNDNATGESAPYEINKKNGAYWNDGKRRFLER
jgi:hypothetical protein